jgi:hypothetical protein
LSGIFLAFAEGGGMGARGVYSAEKATSPAKAVHAKIRKHETRNIEKSDSFKRREKQCGSPTAVEEAERRFAPNAAPKFPFARRPPRGPGALVFEV